LGGARLWICYVIFKIEDTTLTKTSTPVNSSSGIEELPDENFDWSSALESFIVDSITASETFETGIKFPLGAFGFASIALKGNYKLIPCKDSTGANRFMVRVTAEVEGRIGVGRTFEKPNIKYYPMPKGRDRNKIDPETGQKLKKLWGKPMPNKKEPRKTEDYQKAEGKVTGDNSGSCELCPPEGRSGMTSIGLGASASAFYVKAEAKVSAKWDFAKEFRLSNIKGQLENSVGQGNGKVGAEVYGFLKGSVQATLYVY